MAADGTAGKSVTVLRRVNCAQMFFIYPGRAAVLRDQGMTFLSMIQSAGLGDRNLAMIADPNSDNYAGGLGPDMPDLDSAVAWHKQRLRELSHVTEIYHIGNSSGGYGAMLFGHLLGARKVWAAAPRTARLKTADAAKNSLKSLLLSWNGVTEYFIYFSPLNAQDRANAEFFSACPGVTACPYDVPEPPTTSPLGPEWHHWGVMNTLRTSGDLRRLIPPFVAAAT